MPNEIVLIAFYVMWYFLTALAILFILSGLDDLFIDVYYWLRYFSRLHKIRRFKPLTYEQLLAKPEQLIAVLIPCWHEANVIGTMLRHNCYSIDYQNYYLFVGVYPNDPETVAVVQKVAEQIKNVICVVGEQPGPTNKAANLNNVYLFIREFEKKLERPFDIFVFHDSEDIIHPMSFKLYNYLMPQKDMIQIPVFPLEVHYRNFTHWLYADEFSENHTKDIIVRESIKGHVPSAGVGTAFTRHALAVLENPESKTPFSTDSLTEDYRTSLAIRMHGLSQIFVTQQLIRMKWQKKGILKPRYVEKPIKEYIATRALFPMEYKKAVRQKARWIIGIVFQEWEHQKWAHSWRIIYTLTHDRKSFITHFINGFGYLVFLFFLFYSLLTYAKPEYPSLQEQLNQHAWVWWIIIIVTLIMIERLIQRMIAIKRIYGWIPAILSIPRAFYGNILNLHAVLRAYSVYFRAPKPQASTGSAKQPVWDKTDHHFPGSHLLTPYRRRLGDLLVERGIISKKQLQQAMVEQQHSGERLGQVLCHLHFVNQRQLVQVLSDQYNLPLIPRSQLSDYEEQHFELPKRLDSWLLDQGVVIINVDEKGWLLTLGIDDPTNELLLERIINHVLPFKVQFVLIDPNS